MTEQAQTQAELANPYVGPRSFEREDSQFFFGRDEEITILTSLVMAHQASLFFAQSGAGKSSLLQAGLIPELTRAEKIGRGKRARLHQRMAVLPILTVGRSISRRVKRETIANIYVFSALLDLLPDEEPDNLVDMTLTDALATAIAGNESKDKARNPVETSDGEALPLVEPDRTLLIFDQFEELFTTHHEQWEEREELFKQVDKALTRHASLQVLFTMREDCIAALTPYAHLLPESLRYRFRMERLDRGAALQAVEMPAEHAGRTFATGVAQKLVDNLCGTQQHVEPVHLQIVCHDLWEELPPDRTIIEAGDVETHGDVDQALIGFYENALTQVLKQTRRYRKNPVSERRLRAWFNKQLITPDQTRNRVYRGKDETEGLVNKAVDVMKEDYIIRADVRGADIWYELTHDRLIEPILRSNRAWEKEHPNPLADATQAWLKAGQNPKKLVRGTQLIEIKQFAEKHPEDVSDEEVLFLATCKSDLSRLAAATQDWLEADRDPKKLIKGTQLKEAREFAKRHRKEVSREEKEFIAACSAHLSPLAAATQDWLEADRDSQKLIKGTQLKEASEFAETNPDDVSDEEKLFLAACRKNLSPLAAAAQDWLEADRDPTKLLRGTQLKEAQTYAVDHHQNLVGEERAFFDQSIRREREQARVRWIIRGLAAGMIVLLIVFIIWFLRNERKGRQLATSRELAASAGRNLDTDPELSILLAMHAMTTFQTTEAEGVLRQSLEASRVRLTLSGHEKAVNAIAFSPAGCVPELPEVEGDNPEVPAQRCGARLATASADGTVRLWDADSGESLSQPLTGHKMPINAMAFSSDGTRLATASEDGTIRLWDFSGKPVSKPLSGHDGPVKAVVFSLKDTQLRTASANGMVKLWDTDSGMLLGELRIGQDNAITAAAFRPDGTRLATANKHGTEDWIVRLWDAASGDLLDQFLTGHDDRVNALAFSSDGTLLATAGQDRTARVWRLESNSTGDDTCGQALLKLFPHNKPVTSVTFSPDGERLATATSDGPAKVWQLPSSSDENTVSDPLLFTLSGHKGVVLGLAFSPDGTRLATASHDGTAKVWNTDPNAHSNETSVVLENHSSGVLTVTFLPTKQDEIRVASSSRDGIAEVWQLPSRFPGDTNSESLLFTLSDRENLVLDLALSPDRRRLATAYTNGTIKLWDVDSGTPIGAPLIGDGGAVNAIAFSQDGKRLATASANGTVRLWDADSDVPIGEPLIGHGGVVNALAFSPDGKRLATASDDKTAKVWDIAKGKELLVVPHQALVTDVAFSPNGKRLATASEDTAKVWKTRNGKLVSTLIGHGDPVRSVAFSLDGKRLATASEDRTAKMWDVESGQELFTFSDHNGLVNDVAFSPDGRWLATASDDNTVRIHILDIEELERLAWARVSRRELTSEECQQYLHDEYLSDECMRTPTITKAATPPARVTAANTPPTATATIPSLAKSPAASYTPIAPSTPTPTRTNTPIPAPTQPIASRIPKPTLADRATPKPVPATATPTSPLATEIPAPISSSIASSVGIKPPRLVKYGGAEFVWEWEDRDKTDNIVNGGDWYFDIKFYANIFSEYPYDIIVVEGEEAETDIYWRWVFVPEARLAFRCGSHWSVQIARRNPNGSYAGPLSLESERLSTGQGCE